MTSTDYILFTVFGSLVIHLFFGFFFLGYTLLFVWFLVYLQVFLVTHHSGKDGTANLPTHPGS